MHEALRAGRSSIVQYLVNDEVGLYLNAVNRAGETPLSIAIEQYGRGHTENLLQRKILLGVSWVGNKQKE